MKTKLVISVLLVLLSSLDTTARSQSLPMAQRSSLELNIGFWRGGASNTITRSGVRAEVSAGSFVGGLQFTHWLHEHLAMTVSASLLSGKVITTVNPLSVNQQVSSVAPVLFGVKYYAFKPTVSGVARPYLSASVGTYVGAEESNTFLVQESHTETAFGGRLGAGLDFFLSNHLKLGVNAGYNLMSNFNNPIGERKNYNGVDFQVGAGYVF